MRFIVALNKVVCNYRRSPKHRVKHGTVEWSKMVLWNGQKNFDDWPHSGVSFSECTVVLFIWLLILTNITPSVPK